MTTEPTIPPPTSEDLAINLHELIATGRDSEAVKTGSPWALVRRCYAAETSYKGEEAAHAETLEQVKAVKAERDTLREQRDALRKALEPFAKEVSTRSWLRNGVQDMGVFNVGGTALTNLDICRAAEVLAATAPTEPVK